MRPKDELACEALGVLQTHLLARLATCAPRDMAATARLVAELGQLAAPGNTLQRALRLDLSRPCGGAAAVLPRVALMQLQLPGLPVWTDPSCDGSWLVRSRRRMEAWGQSLLDHCAEALAACAPVYIQVEAAAADIQWINLMQAEALRRLFSLHAPAARVFLHPCLVLNLLRPSQLAAGEQEEALPLGFTADARLVRRLVSLLASPPLVFSAVNVVLGPSTLPALAALVRRGGVTRTIRVLDVAKETDPLDCADWFASMADGSVAPASLEIQGYQWEHERDFLSRGQLLDFIPPAAACLRFKAICMPPSTERRLSAWPALREAEFDLHYIFLSDPREQYDWTALPLTLTRLSLRLESGYYTNYWLYTAENLLAYMPALKAVTLFGADFAGIQLEPATPHRDGSSRRPLSKVRKMVHVHCIREVAASLATWRRRLAQQQIGLRVSDLDSVQQGHFSLRRGAAACC